MGLILSGDQVKAIGVLRQNSAARRLAHRGLSGNAVSSEHRLLWGWIRLVLGLTQMAFAAAAVYLVASIGFHWRALVAVAVAGLTTGASRYLYAGKRDAELTGNSTDDLS